MAERRLRFAMRRLAWLVPRAHVRLSDDNGPRGGVDKRCHVEIRTHSVGTVVITALARDWPSALENAIGRASRVLVRSLRRGRPERVRRRQLAPAFGFER
jgi:hypothetical protein